MAEEKKKNIVDTVVNDPLGKFVIGLATGVLVGGNADKIYENGKKTIYNTGAGIKKTYNTGVETLKNIDIKKASIVTGTTLTGIVTGMLINKSYDKND